MSTTTVPAVISCCYGGFGLSEEAEELLLQKRIESGVSVEEPWCYYDYGRHRRKLIDLATPLDLVAFIIRIDEHNFYFVYDFLYMYV